MSLNLTNLNIKTSNLLTSRNTLFIIQELFRYQCQGLHLLVLYHESDHIIIVNVVTRFNNLEQICVYRFWKLVVTLGM